ncbi:MAG: GNAT family N-acetyltransferase [Chloroflexi bacterium]|nr:GNAT family N-acetyltransferase [Chloroflexota bacterium]
MISSTNPGWEIGICAESEAQALVDLWKLADATPSVTDTSDDVRKVLRSAAAQVLVARIDGRLAGSIIGTFDGWRGNIYRLAVHPDYRRRGMARALLQVAEEWLRFKGAKRNSALVEEDHPAAVGFWQGVGYDLRAGMIRYVRNL